MLRHTSDGSHTLFSAQVGECYHSVHGAIQESQHVFIEAGLRFCLAGLHPSPLTILEIGFGTGLNAFLTWHAASDYPIAYHTVEAFPLSWDTTCALNYPSQIGVSSDVFETMHTCAWDSDVWVSSTFLLHKYHGAFPRLDRDLPLADLIYFDAFSPTAQPDLWTVSVFEALYARLHSQGVLVTYCAKGDVKRALREVGFRVQRLPGPPGKHHMVRAVKL